MPHNLPLTAGQGWIAFAQVAIKPDAAPATVGAMEAAWFTGAFFMLKQFEGILDYNDLSPDQRRDIYYLWTEIHNFLKSLNGQDLTQRTPNVR